MVADINPGILNSLPQHLTVFNDNLYFGAHDGTNGYELWKTDGTGIGSVMVADINPDGDGLFFQTDGIEMIVFNDELYFMAQNATSNYELWVTSGSELSHTEVTYS